LAGLAEARKPLPGSGLKLFGIRAAAKPITKKKDVVWFALDESRRLFAFAGIWTSFSGARGTKSKPIPGPHLVYGFLTTAPKAAMLSAIRDQPKFSKLFIDHLLSRTVAFRKT
jgi:hypothetical protein